MNKLEKFRELGLSDKTLKALSKKGFEEPSPIPVSYTHLTLPTKDIRCRSRWSPYH